MARKAKATVQMDKNGRVTIPKSTRLALGVNDEYADLNLEVEVVKDEEAQTFEARLPDGRTKHIDVEWCPKAQWYVGRHDGGSFYFESGGEQV